MILPDLFLTAPLAHRGFHDAASGRPENSRAAFEAAIAHGYGIELDLQLSADGQAMVFHDYDLKRLTAEKGPVRQRMSKDLSGIRLRHGDEGIPTLTDVLDLVDGRVPLLIEIKDQDGAMGPRTGQLEQVAAEVLKSYQGPAAVMSFNPHAVAAFSQHHDGLPLGLTTAAFKQVNWPLLPAATRKFLRSIPDFDRVGASFISHDVNDLKSPHVSRLKSRGIPVLTWTIRSAKAEETSRQIADNITFEGYEA
ncbi:glycerophosphodiester phosphodiesterase family protein [Aliiroseovarius subalbicans]|uniref:glycerophosphodiester phosphodiesterase family protein n=1 Tax=Aliiroseovarius subalbicans TaxID=2925840 RepID=UPI001F5947D4|nr:glycerophosphodiester phosphodiesterase family protein [Aliiroseovarius subalbicans]MCI2399480.1 phosphodiesterase [Aliiroseovarius subalbicans]